jgi:hypothetical protein
MIAATSPGGQLRPLLVVSRRALLVEDVTVPGCHASQAAGYFTTGRAPEGPA